MKVHLSNSIHTSIKISIPARINAPATTLNISIVAQDQNTFGQRPVLLILPGGPGAAITIYQPYATLLDVADLVFHDPRGVGLSDRGDEDSYTMTNYIEDVEAIRKHLALNQIQILGKSYGCSCAIGYCLKYQRHVSKAIFSCGPASYRFLDYAKRNIKEIGTPQQIESVMRMLQGDIHSQQELNEFFSLTSKLYAITLKEDELASINLKGTNYSFEPLRKGFSSFLQDFDFEDQLHNITIPSLTIAAENDWIVDPSYIKQYTQQIPNNAFYLIENAGHSVEKDAGSDYFTRIRSFLIEAFC